VVVARGGLSRGGEARARGRRPGGMSLLPEAVGRGELRGLRRRGGVSSMAGGGLRVGACSAAAAGGEEWREV
jgi:hypothetical protein